MKSIFTTTVIAFVLSSLPLLSQSDVGNASDLASPLGAMLEGQHEAAQETPVQKLNRKALQSISQQAWKEALTHLMAAMKEDPSDVATYINFGKFYFAREEYPSAEKALLKALEVGPENAQAHYQYSRVQFLKGEKDIALQSAKTAIENTEEPDWKYQSWLGDLQVDRSDFNTAAASYSEACELLKERIEGIDKAIMLEEQKEEVVEQWTETEIVTEFGGNSREVEVTRYRTEKKEAPEAWHKLRASLANQLSGLQAKQQEAQSKAGA